MSNHNPYELLYLIHQNDEEAFQLLFQQALPLISVTHLSCKSLISFDDWKTDAMLCLEQTINRYREDEKTEFFSFYVTLLRNHAKELWRTNTRQKVIPAQALVPYEVKRANGDMMLVEETSAWQAVSMEGELLTKITCDQVLAQLAPHLNETEQKTLDLLRQGYSNLLISQILQISTRKVNRIIKKAFSLYQSLQKGKSSQITIY